MIKQNLQKISRLIKESAYLTPEIFLKVYHVLSCIARQINEKEVEYNVVNLFADIYKFYKKYLTEQPYQLHKFMANKIITEERTQQYLQISNIIAKIKQQLASFKSKEITDKLFYEQLQSYAWAKKLEPIYSQNNQKFDDKQKSPHFSSQLSRLFWTYSLKNIAIVHVDVFISQLIKFLNKFTIFNNLINDQSKIMLTELVDHDHKYYLTLTNCNDFWIKIREPEIVRKIYHKANQKQHKKQVQSGNTLKLILKVQEQKQKNKETSQTQIVISGNFVNINGIKQQNKIKPLVSIGSSLDNDLVLKCKYISRKQMIIIQDKQKISHSNHKQKNIQESNFSIVCLSSTNFTTVSSPLKTKIYIGLIFFVEQIKVEIIDIKRQPFKINIKTSIQLPQQQKQQIQQDQDLTLSILPPERDNKQQAIVYPENSYIQTLKLLILSGHEKGKQIEICSSNWQNEINFDSFLITLKPQLLYEDHFYIRPQIKFLAKTANEILEGRLSKKLKLISGMQIYLDEYNLVIL